MTINLPDDLERFLRAEVHRGHFPSEEDAVAAAIRLLRNQVGQRGRPEAVGVEAGSASAPDPVLGAMRDAADEMDEIVAEALRHREQQPWRLTSGE
jgi:Arc/MetJ-type ribon-helix-helix transcriptional regulator